jgi:hypothetical protein
MVPEGIQTQHCHSENVCNLAPIVLSICLLNAKNKIELEVKIIQVVLLLKNRGGCSTHDLKKFKLP